MSSLFEKHPALVLVTMVAVPALVFVFELVIFSIV
jgi:hypothetical protein